MKKTLLILGALMLLFGSSAQAALRKRAEVQAVHATAGNYRPPCSDCLGGDYLLFSQNENVTLSSSGGGYYFERWEVEYWKDGGALKAPHQVLAGTHKGRRTST